MSRDQQKGPDRLAQRLAALKAAAPVQFDAPEPRSKENRRAERRSVYRFARLLLPNRTVLACIVKDISATGARITIEGAITLPAKVILKIDQSAETHRCFVMWQEENHAGLAFDHGI